ncbi:MAG: hypothetical protein E7334_03265 [Clostridiales bacterium]|nr:hypothetical protein [Clostridiales bacterium]
MELFSKENMAERDDVLDIFDEYLPDDIEEGLDDIDIEDGEEIIDGIRVVYNGREQTVSRDDAPTLIQKGMNYDHVAKELEELRGETSIRTIKEHAAKRGVDYKEYIGMLERMSFAGEADALKQKGVIDRTQELILKADEIEREAETKRRVKEQYEKFVLENPDIDAKDLPEEVLKAPLEGGDIMLSYLKHKNAMLTAKLSALTNHEAARHNSVGSASGQGEESEEEGDMLWKAFMGRSV